MHKNDFPIKENELDNFINEAFNKNINGNYKRRSPKRKIDMFCVIYDSQIKEGNECVTLRYLYYETLKKDEEYYKKRIKEEKKTLDTKERNEINNWVRRVNDDLNSFFEKGLGKRLNYKIKIIPYIIIGRKIGHKFSHEPRIPFPPAVSIESDKNIFALLKENRFFYNEQCKNIMDIIKIPKEDIFQQCFRRGKFILPFKLITGDKQSDIVRHKNITFDWAKCDNCRINCGSKNLTYKLPPDIQKARTLLVQKQEEENISHGLKHEDDPEYKLQNLITTAKPGKGEGLKYRLEFCKTTLYNFLATNLNLDETVLPKNDEGKTSIREKYFKSINDIMYFNRSILSNRLGMNILLVVEKGKKAIFCKRTLKTTHTRGFYQVSACGHLHADDLNEYGKPDPFIAAQRITENELGVKIDLEKFTCLGLGVDFFIYLPHIFFEVEFDVSIEEIKSKKIKESQVIDSIYELDLNSPENFIKVIMLPNWEVEGIVNCILSFEKRNPNIELASYFERFDTF